MKKLYQTILVFVLFTGFFGSLFSNKVFAVVDAPCTTKDMCGAAAGCSAGEQCTSINSGGAMSGTTELKCKIPSTSPNPCDPALESQPGCNSAKYKRCGNEGGCPVSPGEYSICTYDALLALTGDGYFCASGTAAESCKYGLNCTTKDGCGATGGCPDGQRCVGTTSGMTGEQLKCLTYDPTCTPTGTNCDGSKAEQCGTGGENSCPQGYMCRRKTSGAGADFQCYTDSSITAKCGNTTGEGKSCTAAQAALQKCGYHVGCIHGETCIQVSSGVGIGQYKCISSTTCQPADCVKGGCPIVSGKPQECVPYGGTHQCQSVEPPKSNLGEHETCNNSAECQSQFYCRETTKSCECGKDKDVMDTKAQCCSGSGDLLPNNKYKCNPQTGAASGCRGGTGVEVSCDPAADKCCDHQSSPGVWEPFTCRITAGRKADGSPIFTCQPRDIITKCRGTLPHGSICSDDSGCQCQSGKCAKTDTGKKVCLDPKIVMKAGNLNITKIDNFDNLITLVFGFMVPFALVLGVILIAKAAYKIKMSQGNPQEINAAIEELWHAIVGTAVVLLAMVLIRVMINALLGPTTI